LAGGEEIFARWREAGRWWAYEPPREVRRFIDAHGIRREVIEELAAVAQKGLKPENPRIVKVRDETMARAFGYRDPKVYGPERKAPCVALHCLSGYAFGRGGMLAAEIPSFSESVRYHAMLLADPYSLMGACEFDRFAREVGVQPLIGATFEMPEGGELVLVAKSNLGYKNLSRLITACHLNEPRLFPLCRWERLAAHRQDLLCLTGGDGGVLNRLAARRDFEGMRTMLQHLIDLYGRGNVFVQIERSFLPWEIAVNDLLLELAEAMGVTPVAGGPITHHRPESFPAQDVLVCIDTLCTIEDVVGRKPQRAEGQPQVIASPRRALNGERYLRSPGELRDLFADRPDLVENTLKVSEACNPERGGILPERTKLPKFGEENEPALLRRLTMQGARVRFGERVSERMARIEVELSRIAANHFERHFLVAWDMCRWADSQGIVYSGRGSVVDSYVGFCLGLSRINAHEFDLHFDRFLPDNAHKRPDIDIDFEAHRREDVRGYLTQKYGEKHVATVAAFGAYGSRGIIREVGKVMGIASEHLGYLTKRLHGGVTPERLEAAIDQRPELRNSDIPRERFHWVFHLAEYLMDIPRNARAHSSGIVISEDPIEDTVPMMFSGVESVPIIQWDKRSAKYYFDKFDVLCLRGNDVLSDIQGQIRTQEPEFDVRSIRLDDPDVYRTMREGHLIGVPQSASPAMRQAHIRVQTKDLKDAGIVQAAIRPGVGGAVKMGEYIARRRDSSRVKFFHPDLEEILGHTLGIVVFQEQVDLLLQKFAGYTSDQAEEAREGIYKRRKEGYAESIRKQVADKIEARGYSPEVAQEVFSYVAQFEGYGFAQGHALAFADISVRSVWCQQNYTAQYFAALLNAQPAGYYGPCTIANEARSRGVKMLPPDVNVSGIKFVSEEYRTDDEPHMWVKGGIRTGLMQINGIHKNTRERIVAMRERMPYRSFFDFVARVRPNRDELDCLILAGAFDSLHPNRRALMWAIPRAQEYAAMVAGMEGALPMQIQEPSLSEEVRDFTEPEAALRERVVLDMDVAKHLVAFERERVAAKGGITSAEASRLTPGTKAFVVGNPIRLRFPPTMSGKRVLFFDLEDETGLLNVTCFDDVYQRDGHQVICNPYITLWGEAQDRDGHIAFLAHRIYPYRPWLLENAQVDEPLPFAIADFLMQ
jgi:error-prone DNA polymerase